MLRHLLTLVSSDGDNGDLGLVTDGHGDLTGNVVINDKCYKAVINYGARPTFGLQETLLEAHLIGFDGDLYGQTLTVNFERFLRCIQKFECVEDLKKQIEKDVALATEGKTND